MTHLEDSKIIALFYERSEQAIAELDNKYGAAVKKTASNILKDKQDVEECTSDTYLAVWDTIPPKKPIPLISYVCKIARNLAVNRVHAKTAAKRNATYDLALDELEGDVAGVGGAVVRIAGYEAVRNLREDALLKAVSEALNLGSHVADMLP